MDPLLYVDELEIQFHTFTGTVHAVRNVNFHVNVQETVAIVGESGSGKSVTAQSLLKLIPMPPGKIIQGTAYFLGKNLLTQSEKELQKVRGKEIGFIFQDPMTCLNPTMKIGSQIIEGLKQHNPFLSKKEAENKALEWLQRVAISDPKDRLNQFPHQFSGGMRQRIMIAIALSSHPKLLIADEPTTALDATVQVDILNLIKSLQKEMGMSLLLITHDLRLVEQYSNRVIVMYGGKIMEQGNVSNVFNQPAHPYTQSLLKALPSIQTRKRDKLFSIPGSPPNLVKPPSGCPFWLRCSEAMKICQKAMPSKESVNPNHETSCWLKHKPK